VSESTNVERLVVRGKSNDSKICRAGVVDFAGACANATPNAPSSKRIIVVATRAEDSFLLTIFPPTIILGCRTGTPAHGQFILRFGTSDESRSFAHGGAVNCGRGKAADSCGIFRTE
jgi:hypothetical protein